MLLFAEKNPGCSDEDLEVFKASRRWILKFKLVAIVLWDSVSLLARIKQQPKEYDKEFKNFVDSEQCCDKTGLFWKKIPKKSTLPGDKPMKDRLTLVLCGYARGDRNIRSLLVYTANNLKVFKKLKVETQTPPFMHDNVVSHYNTILNK